MFPITVILAVKGNMFPIKAKMTIIGGNGVGNDQFPITVKNTDRYRGLTVIMVPL